MVKAALKVNLPVREPWVLTTRWPLSKISLSDISGISQLRETFRKKVIIGVEDEAYELDTVLRGHRIIQLVKDSVYDKFGK